MLGRIGFQLGPSVCLWLYSESAESQALLASCQKSWPWCFIWSALCPLLRVVKEIEIILKLSQTPLTPLTPLAKAYILVEIIWKSGSQTSHLSYSFSVTNSPFAPRIVALERLHSSSLLGDALFTTPVH